jgi:hypothetical protein
MTNFSNVVVQAKDFGAYAFALRPGLWALDSGPTDEVSLNSGSPELLAHNNWDLSVRVPCRVASSPRSSCTAIHTFPVGSTLQLLILSWTSSKGVVPTGGRYGYVLTGAFLLVVISDLKFRLTCPFLRFTRLRAQPFFSP